MTTNQQSSESCRRVFGVLAIESDPVDRGCDAREQSLRAFACRSSQPAG
jgi:hypothetical protein